MTSTHPQSHAVFMPDAKPRPSLAATADGYLIPLPDPDANNNYIVGVEVFACHVGGGSTATLAPHTASANGGPTANIDQHLRKGRLPTN